MPKKRSSVAYRYNKMVKSLLENGRIIVCPLCLRRIYTTDVLSVDHKISLAKGGADKWSNMCATHLTCNQAKGAN